ncbi:HNH endonuclease [Kluyvera ascorbata]|uniref:HNH endonuclease n=1 Tax=Kluyvera ascorbata TaxID=51288 RepID=UPI0004E4556E|nr:HNH endonuclease [Kluyvera ascorbata]EJG2388027.1 HNH endonuclease [Kluyvera ascorbata]KFC94637.1 HNH endonuclease [Kluyvera ascorbata ATCC 33433]MDU1198251.1 HNH endonuclease [Kluyvera ascorbata]STW99042.1 Predicted restriction endonuclease [Kluyvera ascorbata]BCA39838.1 hypothetical protein KATP_23600 [Kluyvera ascorbata]
MMKYLFCHIGWMNDYHGATENDSPLKGGKYNENNIGHEACNFVSINGSVYGYVQVTEGKTINIAKLGADSDKDYAEFVTVVWLATAPDKKGLAVVGWYKDATVYRDYRETQAPSALHLKDAIFYHNISAKAQNAHLLPPSERTLVAGKGKGWPGTSPLWYAQTPEAEPFIRQVRELIDKQSAHFQQHRPVNSDTEIADIPDIDLLDTAPEGREILVTHIRRERNSAIVKQKKASVLRAVGYLECEVCGFNFKSVYGDIGNDFCEAHHIKPLAETTGSVTTTSDDLVLVCSNCHRMIHRISPVPTIEEFKARLVANNTEK